MLGARRGLSWKQKKRTLSPSSASDAAADAPASPVPTTITSNLRLLVGLINFDSNRCLSHFSARGPEGIFAFSSTLSPFPGKRNTPRQDRDRNRTIADQDDPGQNIAGDLDSAQSPIMD